MLQLVWNFSASVSGGPSVAAASSGEIAALDKAVVTIQNNGTDSVLDLQPSPASKILLLVAQCSVADPKVTIKLSDGAATTPVVTGPMPLDSPLLLAGAALSLLSGPPIQAILNFATGGAAGSKATIELLVARER
jgi:hypothetical protein